jgi:hypothetical protein
MTFTVRDRFVNAEPAASDLLAKTVAELEVSKED